LQANGTVAAVAAVAAVAGWVLFLNCIHELLKRLNKIFQRKSKKVSSKLLKKLLQSI
jgi:hypothetical protein